MKSLIILLGIILIFSNIKADNIKEEKKLNPTLMIKKKIPIVNEYNIYLDENDNKTSSYTKISPQEYEENQKLNLSKIPINDIYTFMEQPQLLSQDQINKSLRIISPPTNKLIFSKNDIVYSTNAEPGDYLVYRIINDIYSDTLITKKIAKEIEIVGEIASIEPNNKNNKVLRDLNAEKHLDKNERYSSFSMPTTIPQAFIIVKSNSEIREGDFLLKKTNGKNNNFIPHLAKEGIQGRVFHVYGRRLQNMEYGKYHTILIDFQKKNNVDNGTIISLYRMYPKKIRAKDIPGKMTRSMRLISYPTEEIGKALVYYTKDNLAYAIIYEIKKPVQIGDIASNPGRNLEDIIYKKNVHNKK